MSKTLFEKVGFMGKRFAGRLRSVGVSPASDDCGLARRSAGKVSL